MGYNAGDLVMVLGSTIFYLKGDYIQTTDHQKAPMWGSMSKSKSHQELREASELNSKLLNPEKELIYIYIWELIRGILEGLLRRILGV